jgi:hypothetical protein
MIAILATVIGIVFVMLLFSLLASSILELVAGFLSLRGQQMIKAIRGMIGGEATNYFVGHPFFEQLAAGSRERTRIGGKKRALPSYISAGTFSAILLDIMEIDNRAELETTINNLPEGPSKKLAQFLFKQSNGELLEFKKKLEEWFNEVMDRASGAYKRTSQRWLLGIGLSLAVVFNVDVINVYHNLSINATLRNMVADAAGTFVNNSAAPVAPNLDNPDINAARQKIGSLVNENIAAIESPLGLGWETVDWQQFSGKWVLYKLIGWLTTAIGISLGATFWFELLRKLVNLRASGPAPAPAPTSVVITQAPPPAPVQSVPSGGLLTQPPADSGLESTAPTPRPTAKRAPRKPTKGK